MSEIGTSNAAGDLVYESVVGVGAAIQWGTIGGHPVVSLPDASAEDALPASNVSGATNVRVVEVVAGQPGQPVEIHLEYNSAYQRGADADKWLLRPEVRAALLEWLMRE